MPVQETLHTLGLKLPQPAAPLASYVPAVRTGNLVFTSGQLPSIEGTITCLGKVGLDVTPEEAVQAAQTAVLNALAAVASVADLEKVTRIVHVTGYVNSTPDFSGQPAVLNGASDLLLKVFGEAGKHTRAAVGVMQLPLNAAVEIDLVVELSD